MAKQVQLRRGTTAEHANFIGALGEVTVDTDLKTLRVHDGVTPGGHVIGGQAQDVTFPENMDYVIETQLPTSANNYTWYRKYKSGWVEQGQETILEQIDSKGYIQKTFPIAYTHICYCIANRVDEQRDAYSSYVFGTGFRYYVINGANTQGYTSWYSCGYTK